LPEKGRLSGAVPGLHPRQPMAMILRVLGEPVGC
jgi:hypothetical protein